MQVSAAMVRTMMRGWLMLVAAGLALTVALSAQAAWRAIADRRAAVTSAPPRGYEAEAHFPGAALLYAGDPPVADETAAPAKGVTGTIALPALPIPAAAEAALAANDRGIVAAAPFSMRNASATDRSRAMECLTAAIYYEAASEPDAGQAAVAQVILNRARHPAFPATVCGVVYQGSERSGCQFSYACDGSMARTPVRSAWARAARTAAAALAGYVYAPVGLATHYHTYAVTPSWNRSLVMTDVVGAHLFHRWKGYWGTAAAFHQRYVGGEPLPGPHQRIAPLGPLSPTILASADMPVPDVTRVADIQPGYAQSGSYVAAPPPPVAAPAARKPVDNLPPASQVLDKWKDSGKPLF